MKLPSFAESRGFKSVDACEVGTLRSLGARPSQPKHLLRRSRQGGGASALARPRRLRPTEGGGVRGGWGEVWGGGGGEAGGGGCRLRRRRRGRGGGGRRVPPYEACGEVP